MKPLKKTCDLLKSLGHPVRAQILLAIDTGEVCVCHLEVTLGLRQATISQQLMILRRQKIIRARREGKYIFYRLTKPEVLEIIRAAGDVVGVTRKSLMVQENDRCECPKCGICETENQESLEKAS
jgi:DNA-binding transcriptional ArsR family regulator